MLTRFLLTFIDRQTLASLYNLLILILKTIKTLVSSMSQPSDYQSSTDKSPPFDPTQPSIPISYPLKTLQELKSRAYFNSFHYPFNKSSVSLKPSIGLPKRPRLLVCHDFQGGYVDDKWVQGGTNFDAFGIWHWHLIDVFVYFSHYLVTLPPPSWTNAAHRHGVKVLGTFITEWDEGRVICKELLETEESARMYAEHLAELAVALGFDGWLINMEIKLEVEQITKLKEFVNHLTLTMHSSLPGSLVIWYDSVTIDGDLKWQDQLNDKNKPFFDICDGIFVNYTWKRDYPKLSAIAAGDRKFDVYMGIDVFGRNTYGGGEWQTNVALDVIKENDVSAAIFAPGWVYETKQETNFQTAQNRWWDRVEKSWGRVNKHLTRVPFYSNFDQGHGYHTFIDGVNVKNASWNNISCQGFQTLLEFKDDPSLDSIQVLVDFKEASYNGGGNITFKGTLEDDAYFTARLFLGELPLGNLPVQLTYSVKSEGDSLLGIVLWFSSIMNEKKTSVLIAPRNMNKLSGEFTNVILAHQVKNPESTGWILHEASIAMSGHILTEIHSVCYRLKCENRELRPDYNGDNQDTALHCSHAGFFAVLGHIVIADSNWRQCFPPSTDWSVEGEHIKSSSDSQGSKTISLKITWKLRNENDSLFTKYNIFVETLTNQNDQFSDGITEDTLQYLGVAHVDAYYVSDLSVPYQTSSLKFYVQPCSIAGGCQKLHDCPYFPLDLSSVKFTAFICST